MFTAWLIWIGKHCTQTLLTDLPLSLLLHSLLPLPQPPSSPPRRWPHCPASSSSSPAASWCHPGSVFPWSVSQGLWAWQKPLRELWRRVRPRSERLVNRRSTAAPQSCSSGSRVFSRPLSTPWSPERHHLYWASLLRWPLLEWFLWWVGRIYKYKYKYVKEDTKLFCDINQVWIPWMTVLVVKIIYWLFSKSGSPSVIVVPSRKPSVSQCCKLTLTRPDFLLLSENPIKRPKSTMC